MAIKSNRKILFSIGSSDIGGTELQILRTAELLNTQGYECEIWVLGKRGPLNALAESLDVSIKNFNINLRSKPILGIFQLLKIGFSLREKAFAVVHVFLPEAIMAILPLSLIFSPASKRIAGVRGSLQKSNFLIDAIYRIVLSNSWGIICNAEYLRNVMLSKFRIDPNKIHVVHNGVANFEIRARELKKVPVGIVIANFHSYKGHLALLDTLSRINEEYQIILCGTGVLKNQILTKIIELNLSTKVKIDDSKNNVVDSLKIADFAIHPSETEGLSNAILEELSAGLPVVAFNVGGNPELIVSGVNGYLVAPFDSSDFKSKIENLINSVQLRKQMSDAAVLSAQQFTWDKHNSKLLEIYQGAIV